MLVCKSTEKLTTCHGKFVLFRVIHYLNGTDIGYCHFSECIFNCFKIVQVMYIRIESELVSLTRLIKYKHGREETKMYEFVSNCFVIASCKFEDKSTETATRYKNTYTLTSLFIECRSIELPLEIVIYFLYRGVKALFALWLAQYRPISDELS